MVALSIDTDSGLKIQLHTSSFPQNPSQRSKECGILEAIVQPASTIMVGSGLDLYLALGL